MTATITTWANKVSAAYENATQVAIGCFAEYLENASYAEPDAKGRMPWDLDEHYMQNNILQTIYQQIYGNTADTRGNPEFNANLGNDYFKAVHVLARAEKAMADYITAHPECDESNPRQFLPEVASEDTRFNKLWTDKNNAEKKMDRLTSRFNAEKELFETLFEEAWAYKPYTVTGSKAAAALTPQQQQNAARLRAMANRNTAADPFAQTYATRGEAVANGAA